MNFAGMPKATIESTIIQNDGFYPDLDVATLIEGYAIATEYASNSTLLNNTVILAITEVNRELAMYKLANWLDLNKLTDHPYASVGGVNQYSWWYSHAVFCRAKSKTLISRLGERHRDQRAAQQLSASDNYDHWLKESHDYCRLLMGKTISAAVELI